MPIMRAARKALSLLLVFWAVGAVRAEDTAEKTCRAFLKHLLAVHAVYDGTQVAFTGDFIPIPSDLKAELKRQFPDYSFRIAKMTYVHWGRQPVRLLLVLDRTGKSVRTYLWDVWFTEEPFTFGTRFSQQGQPADVAQARVTALARLICFQMGWTVGDVTIEDGVVFAPLINPEKEVSRIIKCRVTPSFPGEPLSIVHPDQKNKPPAK